MKRRITTIHKSGTMIFISAMLILFTMILPRSLIGGNAAPKYNLNQAGSTVEALIFPREVTSQPFAFTVTFRVQPELNALSSFSVLVNNVDITFLLLIEALKNPGDPDNSYLVHKIQGTQSQVGGSGSRMPLIGSFLSDSQIQAIRDWISQGAQNN